MANEFPKQGKNLNLPLPRRLDLSQVKVTTGNRISGITKEGFNAAIFNKPSGILRTGKPFRAEEESENATNLTVKDGDSLSVNTSRSRHSNRDIISGHRGPQHM